MGDSSKQNESLTTCGICKIYSVYRSIRQDIQRISWEYSKIYAVYLDISGNLGKGGDNSKQNESLTTCRFCKIYRVYVNTARNTLYILIYTAGYNRQLGGSCQDV